MRLDYVEAFSILTVGFVVRLSLSKKNILAGKEL
jgi:hypothetical protein